MFLVTFALLMLTLQGVHLLFDKKQENINLAITESIEQRARLLLISYYNRLYLDANEKQHYFRYQLNYSIEQFQKTNELILRNGSWRLSAEDQVLLQEIHQHWESELRPLLHSSENARQASEHYNSYAPANMLMFDRLIHRLKQEKAQLEKQQHRTQILLLLITIALAVVISLDTHYRISQPMNHLAKIANRFKTGATLTEIPNSQIRELDIIHQALKSMTEQINLDADQASSLNMFALTLARSSSINEIMDEIIFYGVHTSKADAACLFIESRDTEKRHYSDSLGLSHDFVSLREKSRERLFESLAPNKQVLVKYDLDDFEKAKNFRTAIHIPVMSNRETGASLHFYFYERVFINEQAYELLNMAANLTAVAIRNLEQLVSIQSIAMTDPLTGIKNRRAFDLAYEKLWTRALKSQTDFSVLILDIDHFKSINDNFGHLTGDQVLQKIASRISREVRGMDIHARYGGEEFIIVFYNMDGESGYISAERVRTAIASSPISLGENRSLNITASIGLACFASDSRDPATLIDLADTALYVAKENGRNTTVAYHSIAEQCDRNHLKV